MQKIIVKVLSELNKDKPDLSYIRGLLEGLVDEEKVNVPPNALRMPDNNKKLVDAVSDKWIDVPEPKSRIEQIKALAEQSITNA
jgi:hypothetical protein